eukprot:TRINITY_DN6060_c0_g1_i1.p2 TRINITY_DN6060_c0_g1~~TRINITY_DN6060_c0_g1_i1.p2  ORF type:complete len:448 (+),score=73.90 TRINITY_DN6060_c0_g1_i1:335-1678(+)
MRQRYFAVIAIVLLMVGSILYQQKFLFGNEEDGESKFADYNIATRPPTKPHAESTLKQKQQTDLLEPHTTLESGAKREEAPLKRKTADDSKQAPAEKQAESPKKRAPKQPVEKPNEHKQKKEQKTSEQQQQQPAAEEKSIIVPALGPSAFPRYGPRCLPTSIARSSAPGQQSHPVAFEDTDTVLSEQRNGKFQCPTGYVPRCKLTLAILAMQGEATLQNTLQSYNETGLLDLVDEKLIFWQNIDTPYQSGHSKRAATDKYPGFRVAGNPGNSGYGSIEQIFRQARCEYVMFLEEDFLSRESGEVLEARLQTAMDLIEKHDVQVVRLRHRVHFGWPMYAKETFETRGWIETTHELWSVVWTEEPENMYPDHIKKCVQEPRHWCATSTNADFTTNPFMMQREWFLTEMAPNVEHSWHITEAETSKWWRSKIINVAVGDGIFEHRRLDRT